MYSYPFKHILHVDDQHTMLKLLDLAYDDYDVSVRSVLTAQGCMDSVVEQRPDVVLLGAVLEDANGYEVASQLLDHDPSIPVILMSGTAESDFRQHETIDNLRGLIRKPFEVESIPQLVVQLLDGVGSKRRTVVELDDKAAKKRAKLNALRDRYRASLSEKCSEVDRLWDEVVSTTDPKHMIDEVHKIADSAGVYGLQHLAHNATDLEDVLIEMHARHGKADDYVHEVSYFYRRLIRALEDASRLSDR